MRRRKTLLLTGLPMIGVLATGITYWIWPEAEQTESGPHVQVWARLSSLQDSSAFESELALWSYADRLGRDFYKISPLERASFVHEIANKYLWEDRYDNALRLRMTPMSEIPDMADAELGLILYLALLAERDDALRIVADRVKDDRWQAVIKTLRNFLQTNNLGEPPPARAWTGEQEKVTAAKAFWMTILKAELDVQRGAVAEGYERYRRWTDRIEMSWARERNWLRVRRIDLARRLGREEEVVDLARALLEWKFGGEDNREQWEHSAADEAEMLVDLVDQFGGSEPSSK